MKAPSSHPIEQAMQFFRQGRLAGAYQVLRRHFDRIPFRFEPSHAEGIGLFVRVLVALGRENELNFYLHELERLHARVWEPYLAFALGVACTHGPTPDVERGRELFERVLADPSGAPLHVRATLFLAHYHDSKGHALDECRRLVSSLGLPTDPDLRFAVEIWRAKLLRDSGQYELAEKEYLAILRRLRATGARLHWYSRFHVLLGLAYSFALRGDPARAKRSAAVLRREFGKLGHREVSTKIEALENFVAKRRSGSADVLYFSKGGQLTFVGRSLKLKPDSLLEKLLLVLSSRSPLGKAALVRALYGRKYRGASDDRKLHYHVHALRRGLSKLGVSPGAIVFESEAYRMVARLEWKETP